MPTLPAAGDISNKLCLARKLCASQAQAFAWCDDLCAPPDKHAVQLLLVNLLQDSIWGCGQLCCILTLASATSVVQRGVMNGGEAVSHPPTYT